MARERVAKHVLARAPRVAQRVQAGTLARVEHALAAAHQRIDVGPGRARRDRQQPQGRVRPGVGVPRGRGFLQAAS